VSRGLRARRHCVQRRLWAVRAGLPGAGGRVVV